MIARYRTLENKNENEVIEIFYQSTTTATHGLYRPVLAIEGETSGQRYWPESPRRGSTSSKGHRKVRQGAGKGGSQGRGKEHWVVLLACGDVLAQRAHNKE
jgi:hypothetical protein